MRNYIAILCGLFLSSLAMSQDYPVAPQCDPGETKVEEISENVSLTFGGFAGTDCDSDGYSDAWESNLDNVGSLDIDGDGIENKCDEDSDGDGVLDKDEKCYGTPGVAPYGCPESDTYREVFWLHGYRGNDQSGLHIPADYVRQTYKVDPTTFEPNYAAHQESLESCAARVENVVIGLSGGSIAPEKNFIIAHSLGGLVAREMGLIQDSQGRLLYNGLVQLGTCNQGVVAADNGINNPELLSGILTNACQRLTAGPLREGVAEFQVKGFAIGKVLSLFNFPSNIKDDLCHSAFTAALDAVHSIAEDGLEAQLTTSFVPSLPPMATANNATFYGTETADDAFTSRFFGSIKEGASSYPLFQAGASDQVGIADYEEKLQWYVDKHAEWEDNASIPWWQWALFPLGSVISHTSAKKVRDDYESGVNWFPTLNPSWRTIVGAASIEIEEDGCLCIREDNYGGSYYEIEVDCDDPDNYYDCDEVRTNYISTTINKPCDGFILAESVIDAPGVNYEIQHMEGSGHMQMKNDGNMGEAVGKIFDDGLGREFFKTEKR